MPVKHILHEKHSDINQASFLIMLVLVVVKINNILSSSDNSRKAGLSFEAALYKISLYPCVILQPVIKCFSSSTIPLVQYYFTRRLQLCGVNSRAASIRGRRLFAEIRYVCRRSSIRMQGSGTKTSRCSTS